TPSGPATGLAPIEAKNRPIGEPATLGWPKNPEIKPSKAGEAISPKRWIRKMKRANPAARRWAGTTLAVTVLQGPNTIDISTEATNKSDNDGIRSGSRMAPTPGGIAAATTTAASSK